MNTATGYTRINLTIPKEIVEQLKRHTDNMSKYISEAIHERITREKREKALQEIIDANPTFTNVKDGASYVHRLREEDKKRDDRLGIL
jgi:post-segregation antitoxin (ccd killing protein)